MGYIIYIGAALVVGLLIGFITLSILTLRRTVLRNVQSHTVKLISVFDNILDRKHHELGALEAELKEKMNIAAQKDEAQLQAVKPPAERSAVTPAQMLSMVEKAGAGSYRDSALAGTYQLIRDNFSFEPESILSMAGQLPHEHSTADMPQILSWEAAYELSTLTKDEQLSVLSDCLDAEGRALLQAYMNQGREFNIFDFYDSLESRRAELMQGLRLYVPRASAFSGSAGKEVELVEDSGICEGFRLEYGGMLYDYCIKTKELN